MSSSGRAPIVFAAAESSPENHVGRQPPEFDRVVREKLEETFLRIQNLSAARRLYDRLDPGERRRIDRLPDSLWENVPRATNLCLGIWMHLHGVSQPRAIIDVGRRLKFVDADDHAWLLREIGESPELIEDAIERYKLVMDESQRTVYWKGFAVGPDWRKRKVLWEFLWMLAERAKSGSLGVDGTDFGDKAEGYVAKQGGRLRKALEATSLGLSDCIVAADRGTQRLNLPGREIGLFRTDLEEKLVPVHG